MDADRYGPFLHRLAASTIVWTIFLCLFFLLAGFRAAPDGGLRSLFVDWVCGMKLYCWLLPTRVIDQRAIGLALVLAGPPVTSAWASPLLSSSRAPDKQDADSTIGSSGTHIAKSVLFRARLERCWRRFFHGPEPWGIASVYILWLLVGYLLDLFDLLRPPRFANPVLTVWNTVWICVLWTILLFLLPRVVRRILDWGITHHGKIGLTSIARRAEYE